MTAQTPGLELVGLSKSYGETRVLDDVSLQVPKSEFHALLGPSGSGKTTILRLIAGFASQDGGRVLVSGQDMTGVPAEKRDIGVVFQNYALFPHMNVTQNVGFGLRMRKAPKAAIRERVEEVLALVRMSDFGHRKPSELSGGQQQRIALARALVIRPRVLLLDEPLSALDRKIRGQVREELRRIQDETKVTAIIVTHDQEEALSLSDRMLVLADGHVRQSGSPDDVYRYPADAFVADFVGSFNSIPVTVRLGPGGPSAEVAGQALPLGDADTSAVADGSGASLLVRPEQLTVRGATGDEAPERALRARIGDIDFAGPVVTLTVDVGGLAVRALALSPVVLADASLAVGADAWLGFPAEDLRLVPAADPGPSGP